ncbi:diguanylate cyclase [bacterium]|nr:diguanylate cyclase [bacterium]
MDIALFILLNIGSLYFLYHHKEAIHRTIFFMVLSIIFLIITGTFNSGGVNFYFMLILALIIGVFVFDLYDILLYLLIYLLSAITHILTWNILEFILTILGIFSLLAFKRYFISQYFPRTQTNFDFKSHIINFEEKTESALLKKFEKHLDEKIDLLKKRDNDILFFMYRVSGNKIELYKSNDKKLLKGKLPYRSIPILNNVISKNTIYKSGILEDKGKELLIFNIPLEIQGLIIQPVVLNNRTRAILGIVTSNGSIFKKYREFYEHSLSEIDLFFQEIGHLRKLLWDKEEFKFFYEALERLNKQGKIPSIAKTVHELLSKMIHVEKYNFIEVSPEYYKAIYASNTDVILNKWLALTPNHFLSATLIKDEVNILKVERNSPISLNFSGSLKSLPGTDHVITIPIKTKIDKNYIAVIEANKSGKISKNELKMFNILKENLEQIIENRLLLEKFSSLANRDGLTGLYNHKKIQEILLDIIEKYQGTPKEFCVFMLDIDHFKIFNDTYGHKVGDIVLKKVSNILSKTVKDKDYCGRYGGEEFIAIIQDVNLEKGIDVAQRIRKNIENSHLDVGKEVTKITVSIGVAHFPEHGQDKETLIKKADRGLYKAKDHGRNRVDIIE